jgi:hypothetical protein
MYLTLARVNGLQGMKVQHVRCHCVYRVADSDPNWIRIQSGQWIRIRIRNAGGGGSGSRRA